MLIEDGGGGYGGTDWSAMDVVAMWQAIENQDTNPHWQMLSGWRKSYELTLQHLAQVKNYRDNLATAWPPEKSPASAAYLTRLDQLIESLQATYDAAVANYGAFSGATAALATSRSELKKIYDAYVANQAKLADFRAKASRPVGGKALAPPAKPPVTDAQQEQLNNQARAIMYGLSSEIIQARSTLTTPAQYEPLSHIDGGSKETGGTTYTAPPIPPVVPLYPDAAPASAGTGLASSPTSPPLTQPATPAGPGATPSAGGQPGLVLGGVTPGTVTPQQAPGSGIATTPPAGTAPLTGGVINPAPLVPATPRGAIPSGAAPTTSTSINRGAVGAIIGDSSIRPNGSGAIGGGPRPLPPGGMIGAVPGVNSGLPSTSPRTTQHISPVGGVITPTGNATVGQTGRVPGQQGGAIVRSVESLGLAGGRSRQSSSNGDPVRWDPDNPWETRKGVPPVMLPPSHQRVDPGPAIGLD